MGIAALIADQGLRNLVKKVKENVFPRASEEAKELFRIGQERGGILSKLPANLVSPCFPMMTGEAVGGE